MRHAVVLAQESQAALEDARLATADAMAQRDRAAVALVDAGMSYREAGRMVGVSGAFVGQLVKADRLTAWGPLRAGPVNDRATALDAYRVAKHAQEQRCESVALGYGEETAQYYGSDEYAAGDVTEQRLTFRAWLEGSRQEGASA